MKEGEKMNLDKREVEILRSLVKANYELEIDTVLKELSLTFKKLVTCINSLNKKIEAIGTVKFNNSLMLLEVVNFELLFQCVQQEMKLGNSIEEDSRRKAILLDLVTNANDKFIKIDYLSAKLEVSRGTINNDLKSLRLLLKEYEAEIVGITNKGLQIRASEFHIRLVILHYLYDEYAERMSIHISNDHIFQEMKTKITNQFSLNFSRKELFERAIVLSIIRSVQGDHIEDKIPVYSDFLSQTNEIKEVTDYLCQRYVDYFTDYDRHFLCFPLNLENRRKIQTDGSHINDILDEMLRMIYKEYRVYFDKKFLDSEIKSHLIFLLNRLVFKVSSEIMINNKTIEESYPFAYQVARASSKVIKDKLNLEMNESEIAYLSLYFQLAIQERYNQPKKFAIINSFGRSITKLIEERIKLTFFDDCELIEINESEIDDLSIETVNAIFSTDPIKIQSKIPIILITNIFNTEYITETVYKAKTQTLLNNQDISYFFSIHDKKKLDYLPNLEERLVSIGEEKELDPSFYEAILNQEIESIRYEGAFVPHALLPNHQKFLLDFSIFRCKQRCQLIFLIGIPEDIPKEKENILIQIYDFVFETIHQISRKCKNNSALNDFSIEGEEELFWEICQFYS